MLWSLRCSLMGGRRLFQSLKHSKRCWFRAKERYPCCRSYRERSCFLVRLFILGYVFFLFLLLIFFWFTFINLDYLFCASCCCWLVLISSSCWSFFWMDCCRKDNVNVLKDGICVAIALEYFSNVWFIAVIFLIILVR